MTTTRKTYSPKFKARVAVEALRGDKTLSQLGPSSRFTRFKLPSGESRRWTKCQSSSVDGRRKPTNSEVESTALFEEIGRLKVELDWLQKKAGMLD
jgi:transposase